MNWTEEDLKRYTEKRAREKAARGGHHPQGARYRDFQLTGTQGQPARRQRAGGGAAPAAKGVSRQRQGRDNRAQGKKFEEAIAAACEVYGHNGVLCSDKTPEPMKIIKVIDQEKGHFLCCFEKKAQPDYQGTLNGGRSAVWEAKHTVGDRIYQSVVKPDQHRRLEHHHSCGALCFVVVGLAMTDFYRVPWEVWRTMKERYDHKHMDRDELEPYRVPGDPSMVLFLEDMSCIV